MENFKYEDAEDWIAVPFEHSNQAFCIKVDGESNYNPSGEKSYRPGDYITVDPHREPINRSMVVVRLGHEERATLKQLLMDSDGGKMLQSLNPNWPNRQIVMPDGSEIIGVVIGKWVPE